jgi:hypothetical protein
MSIQRPLRDRAQQKATPTHAHRPIVHLIGSCALGMVFASPFFVSALRPGTSYVAFAFYYVCLSAFMSYLIYRGWGKRRSRSKREAP